MRPLQVFIGYDANEPIAHHVCAESIIRNTSVPVAITPLTLKSLNFTEPHSKPGYPPSNAFIFSRFLVPYLTGFHGLAIWLDGDMVVHTDLADMVKLHKFGHAVSVVKHDYKPRRISKYLNQPNEAYPRKNWSSVMIWDCGHYSNRVLTKEFVQQKDGEYLHRLGWLQDFEIGELPKEYNYLVEEDNQSNDVAPKILHWTNGTPCFEGFSDSEFSGAWWGTYQQAIYPLKGHGRESNL